jgi:hypothetical protein
MKRHYFLLKAAFSRNRIYHIGLSSFPPETDPLSAEIAARISFEKSGGDAGSSAGFPRLRIHKYCAARGAPASETSLALFFQIPLSREAKFALRPCRPTTAVGRDKNSYYLICYNFFVKLLYACPPVAGLPSHRAGLKHYVSEFISTRLSR